MRLWIFRHLLTVLPPHGEDADEEGERCHDHLTNSLSPTFSRLFLIITSQGWVAQNSPWLRNTFLNISFNALHFKVPFDSQFFSFALPDRGREHGGQSGERPCGCQGSAEERVSTSI